MADAARILIVDDDPAVRLLIEGVLRECGHKTGAAASAAQALKLLDKEWFDLVVTDKNMAGMDGHMLITEMALRYPQVGAIIVTGYRTDESEKRARDQHVLGYIEKPIYDLQRVAQIVESALQEQRRRLGVGPR